MISFRDLLNNPLTKWSLAIVLLLVALVFIYKYTLEGMEDLPQLEEENEDAEELPLELSVTAESPKDFAQSPPETGLTEITPEDLLPKTDEVKNFENSFKIGKDGLNRNFIAAGHHIGINTVSSSLRNANLTLRSDPIIPRVDIGPWNDSTILSSDVVNRKKFEIGSGV